MEDGTYGVDEDGRVHTIIHDLKPTDTNRKFYDNIVNLPIEPHNNPAKSIFSMNTNSFGFVEFEQDTSNQYEPDIPLAQSAALKAYDKKEDIKFKAFGDLIKAIQHYRKRKECIGKFEQKEIPMDKTQTHNRFLKINPSSSGSRIETGNYYYICPFNFLPEEHKKRFCGTKSFQECEATVLTTYDLNQLGFYFNSVGYLYIQDNDKTMFTFTTKIDDNDKPFQVLIHRLGQTIDVTDGNVPFELYANDMMTFVTTTDIDPTVAIHFKLE